MTRKKGSFIKTILNLLVIVPTFWSLVNKIVRLIGMEAQLAGRSLVSIMLFGFIVTMLITSSWFCLLAMIYLYLTTVLLWNSIPAIACILLLNLLMLIPTSLTIRKSKKNLFFPLTRKQLSRASREHD